MFTVYDNGVQADSKHHGVHNSWNKSSFDTFEGFLWQFRDCFFDNATPDSIVLWCLENKYSCEIRNYNKQIAADDDLVEICKKFHVQKDR